MHSLQPYAKKSLPCLLSLSLSASTISLGRRHRYVAASSFIQILQVMLIAICQVAVNSVGWSEFITSVMHFRWFPLAAPSQHLYFHPQRVGLDSAKKLRLISSAAIPKLQCRRQRSRRSSTETSRTTSYPNWTSRNDPDETAHTSRRSSLTRLFFASLPFTTDMRTDHSEDWPGRRRVDDDHDVLRTVDCDHFNAIPISDGTHMIFTDARTMFLCLGSDAPVGGPTKLLRKVICLPPSTNTVKERNEIGEYRKDNKTQVLNMCQSQARSLGPPLTQQLEISSGASA